MSDTGGFGVASMDAEASQWLQLDDKPIRFYSREDGKEHSGQLVRHVELLGREYMIFRTEPSPERQREGQLSEVRLFGVGYRCRENNDIELLDDDGEPLRNPCSAVGGTSTEATSPSLAERQVGTELKWQLCVDEGEPGFFVPDDRRFKQGHLLGSGGFGDVYEYVSLGPSGRPTGEAYAVKVVDTRKLSLKCGLNNQERLVRWIARLECEVRNQLKLRGHPAVLSVYDAFAHRARFYIVMELVRGTDLGRHLKSRGRLTEEEARGILVEAAEALRHSHAHDVVHRDFKPENILLASPLEPGGLQRLKLVDFGLSKDLSDSCTGTATRLLGTKDYMAPEVRDTAPGQECYDPEKVDVFGLGATLFTMLSGRSPPEGEEVTELSLRSAVWQRVSQEARDLLLGLLCHEPGRRFSLGDALEHPWLSRGRRLPSTVTLPAIRPPPAFLRPPPLVKPGPHFSAVFPEAPLTSGAAKIAADGSAVGQGGKGKGLKHPGLAGAPGWCVVLSWLRADAASAAAQQVLRDAGMAPSPGKKGGFGRPPMTSRVLPVSSDVGASVRRAALDGVVELEAKQAVGASPVPGAAVARSRAPSQTPQPQKGARHISWVTCAARFSSVWRFAKGVACPPMSPRGDDALFEDVLTTPLCTPYRDEDSETEDDAPPPRHRAVDRRPSVIGFVHAAGSVAADGLMVTITHSQRSRPRKGGEELMLACAGRLSSCKDCFFRSRWGRPASQDTPKSVLDLFSPAQPPSAVLFSSSCARSSLVCVGLGVS